MSSNRGTLDNFVQVSQNVPNFHQSINENQINDFYNQPIIHHPRIVKKTTLSDSLIRKIIPESHDIAIEISEKLKKEDGNYLPQIHAYEAHYASTRKRGQKAVPDIRYGLKCQFCNTVFL